jgi:putative PIN family toxin of toxin-antitoxin system
VAQPQRILFDTNILVTAMIRRGAQQGFKDVLADRKLTHITSPFILDEMERILYAKFKLTRQKARATRRIVARLSEIVEPTVIEAICRDPADDHILAAALLGRADQIVTGDKDLLVLKRYKGIQIVSSIERL